MTSAKGFKVTDADRKTRVGIAVRNLEELKKKTIEKFKLKLTPSDFKFQTTDGTIIENNEYFQTIPAQTLLIWVKEGEKAATDAEILYKTIREVNDEYLSAGEKVQEFFTEKMKNKVFKLAEVLRGIDNDKCLLKTKNEHPEWFEGLDTNAKTKEEYMFRRAQDRIRTYYYKTREELLKTNDLPPTLLQNLLIVLHDSLKCSKFHGHYFDRTIAAGETTATSPTKARKTKTPTINGTIVGDANVNVRLCNEIGLFSCQGRWDKNGCLYNPIHTINPYSSREERIIFQTWNLDHNKERSRSIIPAICTALKKLSKVNAKADLLDYLDVNSIYNDLFTLNNLKFVHIVCHDKGAHSENVAGPYLL